MDWYGTVFEVIDTRSFSNMWYWIGLAVVWSSASHYVLGVPWDLVQRGQKLGDQYERDMQDLVRVNVNRILHIATVSGLFALGLLSALLTVLLILAFWYWVEIAQAIVLIALPMSILGALSVMTANRIVSEGLAPQTLYRRLRWHRTITQALGLTSIFVTAMFGMYQNLSTGPL